MHSLLELARRAMLERGLEPSFSPAALEQTQALEALTVENASSIDASIQDLRHLRWFSIDNDTSMDLDQLSVAESLPNGTTKISVAIADVDVLVKRNSSIDQHAGKNTTSVYTAAQVFPMLPEKLSTDLTSLAEHQERIAVVVEMIVSTDGNVVTSNVYRAWVFNHAKLAYNSVSNWLDGNAPPPAPIADAPDLQQQIRIHDSVAKCMRAMRSAHGALSFESIESEVVMEGGVIRGVRARTKNRAKELIEDLMIAANGITARFLEEKGFPSIRRILRTPKRWDRIVALAASLGDQLPSTPDAVALGAFLLRRRSADPAKFPELSLSVIKLLGSGEYAVDVPGRRVEGHFGLAVSDYTHSTAPNRRFADLVTQRLLKCALAGSAPLYTEAELRAVAEHCATQEDNANKVERKVRKSAAALLLTSRVGVEFDAIVTGASEKGTWVRINDPVAEGKVIRGAEGLDVGDHVRVRLLHTDIEQGFIDFAKV